MPSRLAPRAAAAVALLLAANSSQAYIDPNAGNLLYQILLPVVVAIAAGWRYLRMMVANAWHRLVARLRGHPTEESSGREPPPQP